MFAARRTLLGVCSAQRVCSRKSLALQLFARGCGGATRRAAFTEPRSSIRSLHSSRPVDSLCKNVFSPAHSDSNVTHLPGNERSGREYGGDRSRAWPLALAGAIMGAAGISAAVAEEKKSTDTEVENKAGRVVEGLPDYTLEEVARHNNEENGIWVTYKNGVYDITEFIHSHPGGRDKIILAAGKSIEPYWALYAAHNEANVHELLETLRIGNVAEQDRRNESAAEAAPDDPYRNDPKRHPALNVNSSKPFNAEPPPPLLMDSFITPNELFFKRNHLPVPVVDVDSYALEVALEASDGSMVKLGSLSFKDLQERFTHHTITATLQCAGNRRSEMSSMQTVRGLGWGNTAISNATWTGVLLKDVLQYFGIEENTDSIAHVRHVQFEGLDDTADGGCYGASIPVEKATSDRGDVLLAFQMNGEPLPRDHGFPVRAIVPGHVGARNVKWLGRVVLSNAESSSHWQQRDYKGFNPSVTWENIDWDSVPAIQELPVVSAICTPAPGTVVDAADGEVRLSGYAWSGGGKGIARVDVSVDGGHTWISADITTDESKQQPWGRAWAWSLWEATVPIPKGQERMSVCVKATDSSYNTQPEHMKGVWNLRGVLNNTWHTVELNVRTAADS